MAKGEEQIIEGSGNIFADLGMRDADAVLVCAELSHLIHTELCDRHITSSDAARLLGVEDDVAEQLIAGRFVRLSTERLLHLLMALDRDVDIVVRPRLAGQAHAKLRVVSTAA